LYGYPPSNARAGEKESAGKKSKPTRVFVSRASEVSGKKISKSPTPILSRVDTQYMWPRMRRLPRQAPAPRILAVSSRLVHRRFHRALAQRRTTAVAKFSCSSPERQKEIAAGPLEEVFRTHRFFARRRLGFSAWIAPPPHSRAGEAQRIRLATQSDSRLRGVLYVLDETEYRPHARDNARL